MEIHVPRKFTAERPAVRFSNDMFSVPIEEHPLGCRLPKKTGNSPSIQDGSYAFRSFSVPSNLPNEVKHYLTTDEPLISLHVTSFRNATLVSFSLPHSAMDSMGASDLLKAWSSVLANQLHLVPAVLGARDDITLDLDTFSHDEKPPVQYVLQDKQLKGLSVLIFIFRFAWGMFNKGNVENNMIFLPATFISHLRQTAQGQLESKFGRDGTMPFLSDGDLILAWCSQKIMLTSPKKRPTTILNVFDIRTRLSNVSKSGGAYLQNLFLTASILMPAGEASLGQIAHASRQAIIEQTTDTQTRSLLNLIKDSFASTGLTAIFGISSKSTVIFCTNWSKAGFLEAAKFSPAVVSSDDDGGKNEKEAVPAPGTCVSYWGSCIGKNDSPKDALMIYGKDSEKNYWINTYLRPETLELIREEFSQHILSGAGG